MIQIALLAGGPSAERGVSLKSAQTIAKHLPSEKYRVTTIDLSPEGWLDIETGNKVDLNCFCLVNNQGQVLTQFQFAFIIVHGTPAEDGRLQGYLEMMGIPHSACGVLSSALTFNKQMCKDHLKQYDIPMAESVVVTGAPSRESLESHNIKPPLFVKPNNNGSSYGITKVRDWSQLDEAVRFALRFDHEAMIERAISGTEYSCGVVRQGDEIHILPITEILPEGEFFDYAAKYEGHSQEITPARLDDTLVKQCQERSGYLYRILGCRGMVRFDYILEDRTFFLLEANTTPGMSEASIIPQQAIAYGWSIGQLLDIIITDCMNNIR